jgi:hypothetical protein
MGSAKRIGIDFDNTIVGYDKAFLSAARQRGLLSQGFSGTTKQAIRDAIRLLPDGELAWQRLQGFVYGRGIVDAMMFDGVDKFLRRCCADGHEVLVVSHKTEFGHFDPDRVNLREAARDWMDRHGFFRGDGYRVPAGNVFFEGTRAEKLKRIGALGCTHFIDDLEEVFADPGFPRTVKQVLFANEASPAEPAAWTLCRTWQQIERAVLDDDA